MSTIWSGCVAWIVKRTINCRPPGRRWPIVSGGSTNGATKRSGLRSRRRWMASLFRHRGDKRIIRPIRGCPSGDGSLLDPNTLGAHVEPGTLVCLVGDPRKLTAVLLVDDTDIKRLEPGQKTRLRIDELPGQVIEGEVVEVARHELDDIENLKMRQADLSPLMVGLVAPGRSGALYEARVRFSGEPPRGYPAGSGEQENTVTPALLIGGRGDAKVTAERITIGKRLYRYFAQTFRLPM